jgi:hypothetical protein
MDVYLMPFIILSFFCENKKKKIICFIPSIGIVFLNKIWLLQWIVLPDLNRKQRHFWPQFIFFNSLWHSNYLRLPDFQVNSFVYKNTTRWLNFTSLNCQCDWFATSPVIYFKTSLVLWWLKRYIIQINAQLSIQNRILYLAHYFKNENNDTTALNNLFRLFLEIDFAIAKMVSQESKLTLLMKHQYLWGV